MFEGFSKLKPFEQQQQRGSVEGGAVTLQVCDSRFAGLPGDNVTKALFSSFHFGKELSGHYTYGSGFWMRKPSWLSELQPCCLQL